MSEANVNESGEIVSGVSGSQISDMLDKVLANPELIASVASVLSASTAKSAEDGSQNSQTSEERPTSVATSQTLGEKLPELMSMIKPMLGSANTEKSREAEKRACLLSAIKPYVSAHRCEAIDYMIKFSRLAELVKRMN